MSTIPTRDIETLGRIGRIGRFGLRSFRRGSAGIIIASFLLTGGNAARAAGAPKPERIASLTVYGNDPCPPGADDEIVVCGREPESERYRIPKSLRETKYQPPARSWASRVHTLDDVSRAGRPNSCSVVGTGGQTGCYAHALEQWFAERR